MEQTDLMESPIFKSPHERVFLNNQLIFALVDNVTDFWVCDKLDAIAIH